MTVFSAWRDGIRRVNRAPAILAGAWMLTWLVSLPLALALRGMLEAHLGHSLAAESAASGVNYDWMQEFSSQATGIGTTFTPTIIGFGAVLDNLSAFADAASRPAVIVSAAGVYVGLWIFLSGGIIDRYARDHATRASGFFAAAGVFFFRFLRLAVVMAVVYGLLFGYVHGWLFDLAYPRLIRDVTVERTAFVVRAALYLVFFLPVAACNLVFDYAKVRAVVEDRRSAMGAMVAAVAFIRRNAGAAVLLYLTDVALFAMAVAAYGLAAPGVGSRGWTAWLAFAAGQVYVLARLWVKLVFWASETALFQGRLAHAGYVAAPERTWPESPSAEAIGGA
jgi:hypothetical protein